MTPDIFNQSKNLFLVFSPGCGGNHVANLLSMTPDFEPRYTHDNYYENMIWNYDEFFGPGPQDPNGCTAHFSDLENLQVKQLTEFESKIINSKKPYIFCSHAVEYIIGNNEKLIQPFTDKIICLFSKPSGSNKLVNNRMYNNAWYEGERDEFTFLDIPVYKLYEVENFSRYSGVNKDKIFSLNTDLFYSIEGYDYLYETMKTNLGVELPEVCRKMHIQYINYAQALYGKG
jgi:hypothetical protein